jgi:hypothetical protein
MSSTYYVLCMSHDPATIVTEHGNTHDAEAAILERFENHPHCDFLIMRVSGAPVEFGCPGTDLPVGTAGGCLGHSKTYWIDADWLRLLTYVEGDQSGELQKLRLRPALRCWSADRLKRLRFHLGVA